MIENQSRFLTFKACTCEYEIFRV